MKPSGKEPLEMSKSEKLAEAQRLIGEATTAISNLSCFLSQIGAKNEMYAANKAWHIVNNLWDEIPV